MELNDITNITTIIIVFSAIIIYFKFTQNGNLYSKMTTVTSTIDGNTYKVKQSVCKTDDSGNNKCTKLNNIQEAANLLASIRKKLTSLVNHVYKKYPNNPDIIRLKSRFKPDRILENEKETGLTTYTLNKGEKIAFCLRSRDSRNSLQNNENTLIYVGLHELAHLMDQYNNPQHKGDFKQKWSFIIKEAINLGIYTYRDYTKSPEQYCGMTIQTNII